jgi:drug/metabolite transporter (DMT)-like permease
MKQNATNPKIFATGLIFSILVGFSFIFTKLAVGLATPLQMITYRFNFALVAVGFVILFKIVKVNLNKKTIKNALIVAIFYGGFFVLQAIGITLSSSIEAGILYAIVPIMTIIAASFILKEKTTYKQNLFVTMAVLGVVLLFIIDSGETGITDISPIGILFLFLSSISISIGSVFIRKIRDEFTPNEISCIIVIFCFFFFNIISLVMGIICGNLNQYFDPLKNHNFVIAVMYLGVTCTYLSPLLRSYLLSNTEAVKATLWGNAATGISIVSGVLIFGESLEFYHIVCTVMIIIGVIGTSIEGMETMIKDK